MAEEQLGLRASSAERAVLVGFGDLYRHAVAHPDETRNYVGASAGTLGAFGLGTAGLFCGPVAPICSGVGIVGGFAGGFIGGSSLADAFIDPRSTISYEAAGALYEGWLSVEELFR